MIVMKFGGSSVANDEQMQKVLNIVNLIDGKRVIVLSACKGITDLLEHIAIKAKDGDTTAVNQITEEITARHTDVIKQSLNKQCNAAIDDINQYITQLTRILNGVSFLGELSLAAMDSIYSFGELLSTTVFYHLCKERNVNCEWKDARLLITTDSNYSSANPISELYVNKLNETIRSSTADVIITQGFIASNENGRTTTLGRGGSDLTASLIGAAINADEIQIWTDVDGVLTADPNKCDDTIPIEFLSYKEVKDLSFWGAKVLHPQTIMPAIECNNIVKVLNTNNPTAKGTTITAVPPENKFTINSIIGKQNCHLLGIMSNHLNIPSSLPVLRIGYSNYVYNVLLDDNEEVAEFVKNLNRSEVTLDTTASAILLAGQNLLNEPIRLTKFIATTAQLLGDIKLRQLLCFSDNSIILVVEKCDIDPIIRSIHKVIVRKQY
ncbi:MAG: aspartate kinase [Ignavibacteria bacterium]|jgi:aspartate kinase|nr:aspartate kinase [Ignavibacteria bacterium]